MHSALLASASAPRAEFVASAALAQAAEFFALMGAAFAPPPEALPSHEWCELLAVELAASGAALGLDTEDACRALGEAGAVNDDDWLVHYSRLFLVPPVRVTLNTGLYLEGALGGESARMILQCYSTAGLAPSERFRDLPDHVAMQLEFLATLLQRGADGNDDGTAMAREFAESIVGHWIGPLQRSCRQAAATDPAAAAYAALVDVLRQAIDSLLH